MAEFLLSPSEGDLAEKHKDLAQFSAVPETRGADILFTTPQGTLDGVMLSDGSLVLHPGAKNASFYMALAGRKHLDWIRCVENTLVVLGVEVSIGYPKVEPCRTAAGRAYERVVLSTRSSPVLTEQYRRWYPHGVPGRCGGKVAPKDTSLSSIIVADWFMGDGCTVWHGLSNVYLWLCTDNFSHADVSFLAGSLEAVGMPRFQVSPRPHNMYRLVLGKSDEVIRFLKWIDPFVLPSYRYKVKYPLPVVEAR